MFVGQHQHALDQKGRLVVPSAFREDLEGRFYLAIGETGQIDLWPREAFEQRAAEKLARSKDNPQGLYELRMFSASASEGRMDTQFRLPITQELRGRAKLELGAQVITIGAIDHVEIWPAERYSAYEADPSLVGA